MSHYTVLACPACGGKTNLSTDTRSATCDYCGNQLILDERFASPVEALPPLPRGEGLDRRPITPQVPGINITTKPDGVEIARRWYNPRYIFLAVFCLFWDAFLLFWYGSGFLNGAPAVFFLFPLIHVAIGAALSYSTLAGFVNTSYIDLTRESLSIQHAPLPYPGSRTIPAADLRQLYTQEVVQRTKNGTNVTYSLNAVTLSGQKVTLLKGLETPEAGLFIEQQVEQYYGIPNQPVAGEMR